MLTTPIHRNADTLLILDGLKVLNTKNETNGTQKENQGDNEKKKNDLYSQTGQTISTKGETDFKEHRRAVLERDSVNVHLTKPPMPIEPNNFQKGTLSVEPYLRKVVERFIPTNDPPRGLDDFKREPETTTSINLTTTTKTVPTSAIKIIKGESTLKDKIRQLTDRNIGMHII